MDPTILIVGAGPTGLMLACQLARHGVRFRLVDAKSGPTVQSRAMVVQARSLEVYEQLGLADECMKRAHMMHGISVYAGGVRRALLDLGRFGEGLTRFAHVSVLEQSENERILVDALRALGGEVEWGVTFDGMVMMDEDKCVVTLRKVDDGAKEVATFDWVCGCDGARSPVRHALNIPFEGGTYNQTFYVADVDVLGDHITREFGSMFMADAGFALAFPMRGGDGQRFRLIGSVPSEAMEQPGWMENPTFDVVADAFRGLSQMPLEFNKPQWFATYAVHHRKVDSFYNGRTLLLGDAAHVHSPAGGQGMNTGLLDAHNLAWKLALVARGQANPSLLDTFNFERESFAQQLLSTTDNAFTLLAGANPFAAVFRQRLFPFLVSNVMNLPWIGQRAFRTVSQIGIAYRSSTLSKMHAWGGQIQAGDRFPPCSLRTNGTTVDCAELFRAPGFCILDFSPERDPNVELWDKIGDTMSRVSIIYHSCELLVDEGARDIDVAQRLYVLRPDMYVGMVDDSFSPTRLLHYLRSCVSVIS